MSPYLGYEVLYKAGLDFVLQSYCMLDLNQNQNLFLLARDLTLMLTVYTFNKYTCSSIASVDK